MNPSSELEQLMPRCKTSDLDDFPDEHFDDDERCWNCRVWEAIDRREKAVFKAEPELQEIRRKAVDEALNEVTTKLYFPIWRGKFMGASQLSPDVQEAIRIVNEVQVKYGTAEEPEDDPDSKMVFEEE